MYGHAIGDRAIREVASLIDGTGEIVGRLGGEEFAMLLPGRDLEGGYDVAEQVRSDIAALRIPVEGKVLTFTSSFGVSEWLPGETIDEMLRRADMALYAGKSAGRNRVVAARDGMKVGDYDGADRPVRSGARDENAPVPMKRPRSAA
jgi:two-component system cell cycle response regulator